ncbi:hypothetical protein ABI59_03565 [Acidobacteria bacterium Mor1]|nr:hypothetical protein ABI59_03565 [Acidobacteria bacterium Mor1]
MMRTLLLLVIVAIAGSGSVFGQAVEQDRLPPLPDPAGGLLDRPSQAAFDGWPPQQLRERAYWLPWGVPAFNTAALFNRPVLFVMAVRWNHGSQRMMNEVMADPRIRALANEGFVSVIVNPDRRPDVKERYQTGGLPVIAVLLPDGRPMLSQANDLGVAEPIVIGSVGVDEMEFLLGEAGVYWGRWAGLLREVAAEWYEREGGDPPPAGSPSLEASDNLTRWLLGSADQQGGGFGLAPKFVLPGFYEYAALRSSRLAPALQPHARSSLRKMCASPLFDERDGGFHRMAGAPEWKSIEHEKMLEPNSHLMRDLVFALRAEADPGMSLSLERTAGFLLDVLKRPDGTFSIGQWADLNSDDGGGYWRGDGEAPGIEPLALAGTNALAGAALMRAGVLLEKDAWVAAGREAIDQVLRQAYQPALGVQHVLEPRKDSMRFLVAQADTALGLVDAYQVSGEKRYLEAAEDIARFALNNLSDDASDLLHDRIRGLGEVGLLGKPRRPVRANVRLARALIRLHALGRGEDLRSGATRILTALSGDVAAFRVQGIELGLALEELNREPVVVEVSGQGRALARAALNASVPWQVLRWSEGEGAGKLTLRRVGRSVEVDQVGGVAEALARLAAEAGRKEGA